MSLHRASRQGAGLWPKIDVMSALLHWVSTHWGLLAAAAAGVSALVVKGPAVLEAWVRLYRRLRSIPDAPPTLAPDDFALEHNRRFGFRILRPKEWDTAYPTSGDGFSCCHPQLPSVRISAWGEIPIEDLIGTSSALRGSSSGANRDEKRTEEVARAESWRYENVDAEGRLAREKVPGTRSVADAKQDGVKVRVMNLSVESLQGTRIHVCCVAPRHLFASFEPTFLAVCNSMELFPGLQTSGSTYREPPTQW